MTLAAICATYFEPFHSREAAIGALAANVENIWQVFVRTDGGAPRPETRQ